MTKVILKMNRAWGRYNAGEVAGFDASTAAKLTAGASPVATAYDAASAAAARAASENAADLDARTAALDAREEELKAREAALAAAETTTATKQASGAPPAQGQSAETADGGKASK